ncbi:MAG: 50S ribosomal protein L17 [Opitutaceae bacterium]|nr:50S ribosomal protein L17 [Cytophagales bacterium]
MRHGKSVNHLGRKTAHRHAMLSNMASSLILSKRIETTVAKAKALRKYVEPLITKSKEDTTHSRRIVFSYLQNKDSVKTLFSEVSEKIAARPGGYTRIIKTGNRLGDNADMCIIELVDFNLIYTNDESKSAAKKTRRGRKGATSGAVTATATKAPSPEAPNATAPVQEDATNNLSEVKLDESSAVSDNIIDPKVEESTDNVAKEDKPE